MRFNEEPEYEKRGRIVMDARAFISAFKPLLEPEQVAELANGYYEGSTMRVWLDDGSVEVAVGTDYVVIERDDYEKLVRELEKTLAGAR